MSGRAYLCAYSRDAQAAAAGDPGPPPARAWHYVASRGDCMESALSAAKARFPAGRSWAVWNPDHSPPPARLVRALDMAGPP